MKTESLLRRRVADAFMELEAYRDKAVEAMEAIRNSRSRELTERLIDELLGSYGEHKAEVKRLLTVDGKVVPIDAPERWRKTA